MKKFIQHRKQTSNLDSSSEDTQCSFAEESTVIENEERAFSQMTNDSHESLTTAAEPAESTITAEILNKYIESKRELDPIDWFFQTMAATAKKLPAKVQAQIKRQVFHIVNDAEIKYIEENEMGLVSGVGAPTTEDICTNLRHQRPYPTNHSAASTSGSGYEAPPGSYRTVSGSEYETNQN